MKIVLKRHRAYEIFQELKLVFQTHACVERYETSNKYFAYKMEENSSSIEQVLYYNRLNQVGVNLPDKIVIDKVLYSLSPSYLNFVMNYNMQGMTKTIPRALRDAETSEGRIQEKHQVLMVDKTTSFK